MFSKINTSTAAMALLLTSGVSSQGRGMTVEQDFSGLGFKPGSCPERGQNKSIEAFEKYSMAGLWFEYVWDKGYQQIYDYKCSTWIVLSDEADNGPGKYVVYNNMVKRIGENENDVQEGDSEFIKFDFIWD